MTVTTTARMGVTQWSAGTDPFSRAQMQASFAAIEARTAIYLQGTLSARPAFGVAGRFYKVTDAAAKAPTIFYDTGAAWDELRPDLSSYVVTTDTRLSDARTPLAHVHAAGDVTSGVFAPARLASGTPAAGKYVDGSGAWVALPPNPGVLLASVVRDQATVGNYQLQGQSVSDVDATNLAVTFTVPASGVVVVELEAWLETVSSSQGTLILLLRNGNTTVAGSEKPQASLAGSSIGDRIRYKQRFTGLTPGASLTWKWAYRILGSTAQGRFFYGGQLQGGNLGEQYGPMIMEVTSA